MTGLSPNLTYYIRAYATNEVGTAYGEDVSIHTESWTSGTLPGVFSISSTNTVHFSQGNLRYNAAVATWRFADEQYDIVGDNNANISPTYNGWIDLFGWGTGDNPTLTDKDNTSYLEFVDWGTKAITNGGATANIWRTLTMAEWHYLINSRVTSSGIRFAKAEVNSISGLILLPDNWDGSIYTFNKANNNNSNYSSNIISLATWKGTLELNGAVFLPATGRRYGTDVSNISKFGYYWSSTESATFHALMEICTNSELDDYVTNRSYGLGVRLVREIN